MIDGNQIDKLNYLNCIAMLIISLIALFIPFELMILSYALLGPGHYLTEISWLKQRGFFTPNKYDILLVLLTIILSLLLHLPYANMIYYAIALCFIIILTHQPFLRIFYFLLLVIAGFFFLNHNIFFTLMGIYIPTLVHVYLFTGMFLLSGVLGEKRISGYLSFAFFIGCPILLLCSPTVNIWGPSTWALHNYAHFSPLNRITLSDRSVNVFVSTASIVFTRVIAFAYTYHYVNWFSKTSVIQWHRASKGNVAFIAIIWVASIMLYFYNYNTGVHWLFLLSLVHVILEFPLNYRNFLAIGREIKNRIYLSA